jgi:flagellar hook-length control protein FliK
MTTDRTLSVRPTTAPTTRSAASAEQPAAGGFAALLDAHAATRREGEAPARRDDHAPRDDRQGRSATHRENRHDGREARHEARAATNVSPREAARRDLIAAGAPVAEQELHASPEVPFVAQLAPAEPMAQPALVPAVAPALSTPELPVAAPAPAAAALPTPAPQAPATDAQPAIAAQPLQIPAAVAAATTTPAQVLAETAQTATAVDIEAEAATVPGETPAPATADAQTPAPRVPSAPAEQPKTTDLSQATAAPAEEPSAPAQPAAQAAATSPAQPKAEPQTAAPSTPSAPVTAAPDVHTPAALSGQTATQRSVPLHRAPAAVATLLHVAADRGITRARMALKPAELGGIEIRLQSTAAGITAQVVADSPEAARLLAQAGDDLRRALEARDVNLISLEVSTSSDQQRESARGEWSDGDGDDAGLFGSSSRSTGDADGEAEPTPTTHSVIELPGGLLVDVLA